MTVFPVLCPVRAVFRTALVAVVLLGSCGLRAVSAQKLSNNTPGFIRHGKDLW